MRDQLTPLRLSNRRQIKSGPFSDIELRDAKHVTRQLRCLFATSSHRLTNLSVDSIEVTAVVATAKEVRSVQLTWYVSPGM